MSNAEHRVELSELVLASESLRKGGEAFLEWSKELLTLCLRDWNVVASGAILVPQLGQNAGIPLRILAQVKSEEQCFDMKTIDDFLNYAWNRRQTRCKERTVPCSHEKNHLTFTVTPIAFWFDRPIGCFWAVCPTSLCRGVRSQVEQAAALVASSVRSEKACNAISSLAQPAWMAESSTTKTASDVVQSCLAALSCVGAIVWIISGTGKFLKTLVAAGNAGKDIKVDMALGQGVAGKCAEEGRVIVIDDLLNSKELRRFEIKGVAHKDVVVTRGWRSAIFVPFDIGGETVGVMGCYAGRPRGFSELDRYTAIAFAQRLCAGYVHVRRIEELTEADRKITMELPAIEAGMLAMERVHDVDNELTLAQNQLSLIASKFKQRKSNPVYQATIEASGHMDAAHRTIKALVRRSKLSKLRFTRYNLKQLIKEVISSVRLQAEDIHVSINLKCPKDHNIRIDREQLARVFRNMLNNSIFWLETDTKGTKREITISVESVSTAVVIRFKDNGPGIAPRELDNVFNYFYTTKGERGMGFGLPLARRIVEAHSGSMTVRSRWGFYTEFEITLPRASQ